MNRCKPIGTSNISEFVDQVLDGMGQGPHGPPVPKAFEFAVVPFPDPRVNPPCAEYGQYFFVATSENDP